MLDEVRSKTERTEYSEIELLFISKLGTWTEVVLWIESNWNNLVRYSSEQNGSIFLKKLYYK